MSQACEISVIIPCFNHGEFLPEAVGSVTGIGRADIELIVVDDGSTDERTCREMDALRAQGVRVIRQENRGLATARNVGIAASKGEYIFPLDADNRLRLGWIPRGIQILESDSRIGVVYGDAQYFGTCAERWNVGPFNPENLMRWNYIDASALYRRAVWEQNGGYDSTMPVQGVEDWDFWLGAVEHGWGFAYIPEICFDYRRAEQSMITRTVGFEDQILEFVTKKHSMLYREAWLSLANERRSVKASSGNLIRLVYSRLTQKAARGIRLLRKRLGGQKAPPP